MALTPEFAAQLERSHAYELAFSCWLQRKRGYAVLPTCDYNGLARDKAPALEADTDRIVIPDLLAFREGTGAWFDVKLRQRADLYRKTNTFVTGFPSRNLADYRLIKHVSGLRVWIVFVHEAEQVIVGAEIDDLPLSHVDDLERMDRGGTTFFVFDRLTRFMPLTELQHYRPDERN